MRINHITVVNNPRHVTRAAQVALTYIKERSRLWGRILAVAEILLAEGTVFRLDRCAVKRSQEEVVYNAEDRCAYSQIVELQQLQHYICCYQQCRAPAGQILANSQSPHKRRPQCRQYVPYCANHGPDGTQNCWNTDYTTVVCSNRNEIRTELRLCGRDAD